MLLTLFKSSTEQKNQSFLTQHTNRDSSNRALTSPSQEKNLPTSCHKERNESDSSLSVHAVKLGVSCSAELLWCLKASQSISLIESCGGGAECFWESLQLPVTLTRNKQLENMDGCEIMLCLVDSSSSTGLINSCRMHREQKADLSTHHIGGLHGVMTHPLYCSRPLCRWDRDLNIIF